QSRNSVAIIHLDLKLELILPGVNIIGSGDRLAIPCRCCWTMGTKCYHTFPAFSLAKATPTISVFHLFPNSLI
ncbi:MAG: hypothetical protein WAJ93_18350, partial [Candidatus Nitrosopolaris sp.]